MIIMIIIIIIIILRRIGRVGCVVIEMKQLITINECSKLAQKEYKTKYDGEGDPLGIVQGNEISPYLLMVYIQTRICPITWDA